MMTHEAQVALFADDLRSAECVVLAGRPGSGRSTTAAALVRRLRPAASLASPVDRDALAGYPDVLVVDDADRLGEAPDLRRRLGSGRPTALAMSGTTLGLARDARGEHPVGRILGGSRSAIRVRWLPGEPLEAAVLRVLERAPETRREVAGALADHARGDRLALDLLLEHPRVRSRLSEDGYRLLPLEIAALPVGATALTRWAWRRLDRNAQAVLRAAVDAGGTGSAADLPEGWEQPDRLWLRTADGRFLVPEPGLTVILEEVTAQEAARVRADSRRQSGRASTPPSPDDPRRIAGELAAAGRADEALRVLGAAGRELEGDPLAAIRIHRHAMSLLQQLNRHQEALVEAGKLVSATIDLEGPDSEAALKARIKATEVLKALGQSGQISKELKAIAADAARAGVPSDRGWLRQLSEQVDASRRRSPSAKGSRSR